MRGAGQVACNCSSEPRNEETDEFKDIFFALSQQLAIVVAIYLNKNSCKLLLSKNS